MSDKVQYVDQDALPEGLRAPEDLKTFLAGVATQLGDGESILVYEQTRNESSGNPAWYLGPNYGDGMMYVEQTDSGWEIVG